MLDADRLDLAQAVTSERSALLSALFDKRVSTFGADPRRTQARRGAGEEALIRGASQARQHEFRNGRACAAAALARFGVTNTELLRGRNGQPLWPAGFVGSISHSEEFCAAVVARTRDFAGLGVDIEADLPVSPAFARRVCSERELARCAELASHGNVLQLARVVFSVKESAYKLQHPISAADICFRDLEVLLEDGHFSARFLRVCPPFAVGDELFGRWLRGAGVILSSSSLESTASKTM